MLQFFSVYLTYCNRYDAAMEKLESLQKKSSVTCKWLLLYSDRLKIGLWLRETEEAMETKLVSLLITPVQRLPRYILLFTDLKKKTPETHPDYHSIDQLLAQLLKVRLPRPTFNCLHVFSLHKT